MQVPFFLPDELDFCRPLRGAEETFSFLKLRPLTEMVAYFEAGAKDHTWTKNVGGPLLQTFFTFLNEKFYQQQLTLDLSMRIAIAVQENFIVLEKYLKEDLLFKTEKEEELKASSLLFGAFSTFFRDLIATASLAENRTIPLRGMTPQMFHWIKEFFYTGKIELLWREEPEVIFEVISAASHLHLDEMAAYASGVFRRYINKDNVVDYFMLGRQRRLAALSNECCQLMGRFSLGFEVFPLDSGDLIVQIEFFTDEGIVILHQLASLITILKCRKRSAEDPQMALLFERLTRLNHLDFSETLGINPSLYDLMPNVRYLFLSHCDWLDDDALIRMSPKVGRVTTLQIKGNSSLSFRAWGALASLPNLSDLDLGQCSQIKDEDLDLIAASCPALTTLSLAGCYHITDKGIQAVCRQCTELVEVDMSGLTALTEQGIIDFAQHAERLRFWHLNKVKGLTPQAIQQIALVNPSIQRIITDQTSFPPGFLEDLYKRRPSLRIE